MKWIRKQLNNKKVKHISNTIYNYLSDRRQVGFERVLLRFVSLILFVDAINGISRLKYFHWLHDILYYLWYKEFLVSHFFVDHYGKFNWIGITSILAIATLIFNTLDRRRQFKADLISQSRITWIENVRKATAKYLGTLYAYQKTNNDIKMIMSKRKVRAATSKEEDDFDRLWIKQNDLVINLFEATEQVALYFNKNDEEDRNEKILKLIRDSADKIKADLMQFGEAYNATNTPEKENERLEVWNNLLSITEDVKVSEIGNEISDYLKIEWEKAKNGN
ncbi:hypothetical protein RXV91_10895 [Lactiplantibacillus sp. DA1]|uniref:hypothetical protein n=1 Tax=Lactiplantibacillus sp. DA1 TaxID=3079857 RepID=UPI00292A6211|nr:hypothetical protein [Lactiplantibacillus sp. DA1]MDV0431375.1 hypothetical protein [Lactiplantibacillus sp. DA1]